MGKDTEPLYQLTGDNYVRWKTDVEGILRGKRLWSIVDGTRVARVIPRVENEGDVAFGQDEDFIADSYKARAIIFRSLSDKYFNYVSHLTSPKDVWSKLMSVLNKSSSLNINTLARQYQQIELGDGDVAEYFSKLRLSIQSQGRLGVTITDSQAVAKVVNDMARAGKFESFRSFYDLSSFKPDFSLTLSEVESMILERLTDESPKLAVSLAASSEQSKPRNGNVKQCSHCHKKGHIESSCFKKHPELAPPRKGKDTKMQAQSAQSSFSLVGAISNPEQSSYWYVDSGASAHQTNDSSIICDARPPKPEEMFMGGNDPKTRLQVECVGSVKAQVWNGQMWNNVTIRNVRLVPKAAFNLFSTGSMPGNVRLTMQGKSAKFFVGNRLLMLAEKNNTHVLNLYALNVRTVPAPQSVSLTSPALNDSLPIQHERVVHMSPKTTDVFDPVKFCEKPQCKTESEHVSENENKESSASDSSSEGEVGMSSGHETHSQAEELVPEQKKSKVYQANPERLASLGANQRNSNPGEAQLVSSSSVAKSNVLMNVPSNREKRTIILQQSDYLSRKLVQFNLDNAAPAPTALVVSAIVHRNTETSEVQFPYRQAVGSLIWLSGQTRPDLAFPVALLSRAANNPSAAHVSAVKRVFKYLVGTKDQGLTLGGANLKSIGYSDSDLAGNIDNRQSTQEDGDNQATVAQVYKEAIPQRVRHIDVPVTKKIIDRFKVGLAEIPFSSK